MVERPVTALLLGVGGAAMWRFRARLPARLRADAGRSARTRAMVALARRWFYLTQPVVHRHRASGFSPGRRRNSTSILVDLYGPAWPGRSATAPFWTRCRGGAGARRLPREQLGGFRQSTRGRAGRWPMRSPTVARESRARLPIFVTRRGFRDNLAQYVPTARREPGSKRSVGALERFAGERRHPRPRPRHPRDTAS